MLALSLSLSHSMLPESLFPELGHVVALESSDATLTDRCCTPLTEVQYRFGYVTGKYIIIIIAISVLFIYKHI